MGPTSIASLLLTLCQAPSVVPSALAAQWDAARAEHLLNRAGFGAGTAAVARSVALGLEGAVDELVRVESWIEEPFYARKRFDDDLRDVYKDLPEAQRERRKAELREEDRAQLRDFLGWWVERMLDGDEPLRERMVLFWHGHFTSSMDVVKSSYEMIQQNHLFRRHALGSFRELLHGVARDPALLVYLDNVSSKKAHPNENFARELLELFTLGEGHYTEDDVREVARAFTGWTQRNGRFHFDPDRHDRGKKRVLGEEGRLDGADVVEILLRQDACARHVARALLAHFEGVEPEPERLASYAATLRESDYRVDAFLRRLFLDPDFYRDETRASRMTSPFDYLVGCARRLGSDPEPRALAREAGILGQRLFYPPDVRGWEEGAGWATGSALLLRGELVGTLLGRSLGKPAKDDPDGGSDGAMEAAAGEDGYTPDSEDDARPREPASPEERTVAQLTLIPRLNLTQRLNRAGALDDAALAHALVEELLAVPAPPALVAEVEARLADARAEHGLERAPFATRPELAEPLLRELAHAVLTRPEAQLD